MKIMELDELKNAWTSLDERLNKQEKLKESIIREMLVAKLDKSLSRMINHGYVGIIVCLGIIPLFVWRMNQIYFGTFKTILFLLGITFAISGVILCIIELIKLYKIDFSKPVSNNIRLLQNHKIWLKRQNMGVYIVVSILIILAVIAGLLSPNMELWRWVGIAVFVCIGIAGAFWEYKHFYGKNIASILKSLEALKELEEE
jgi:hypothetical protein